MTPLSAGQHLLIKKGAKNDTGWFWPELLPTGFTGSKWVWFVYFWMWYTEGSSNHLPSLGFSPDGHVKYASWICKTYPSGVSGLITSSLHSQLILLSKSLILFCVCVVVFFFSLPLVPLLCVHFSSSRLHHGGFALGVIIMLQLLTIFFYFCFLTNLTFDRITTDLSQTCRLNLNGSGTELSDGSVPGCDRDKSWQQHVNVVVNSSAIYSNLTGLSALSLY